MILRVAHLRDCAYELEHHVHLGRAGRRRRRRRRSASLTGPSAAGWTPRERALLDAVDAAAPATATSTTRRGTRCAPTSTSASAIELVLLVGHYEMLATAIRTLRIEPDARPAIDALATPPAAAGATTSPASRSRRTSDCASPWAMAEADAGRRGTVGTPVADVLTGRGVSRETFYRLYPDKLACFLDAFDLVERRAARAPGRDRGARRRPDRAGRPRAHGPTSRCSGPSPGSPGSCSWRSIAAGPEAMARRALLQRRIGDRARRPCSTRGPTTPGSRCDALVAAISTMVTGPLVTGDLAALDALRPRVLRHVQALEALGLLG